MRACRNCGNRQVPDSSRSCPACGAAIPPAPSAALAADLAGDQANGLPPPPQPWAFQQQSTELAAKIIAALGPSTAKNVVGRIVRAAFLDKRIYREVAVDASLQNEAWVVLGAAVVLSSFAFSPLIPSPISVQVLLALSVVQLIALLAKVWIVQILASTWLHKEATFNQLFRGLAYAQSPAMLLI